MQRLALICDLHIDTEDPVLTHLDPRRNAVLLLDALAREGERNILALGDVSDSAEGLKWFAGELEKRGFVYRLMPGNPDVIESIRETGIVRGRFAYSSANMESFKVLFLDTRTHSLDPEQLAWMKAELADNREDLLVFVHHPILDCGGTEMDTLYPLRNRDEVLGEFAGRPFNVTVFCGHYHTESSVRLGNIVQLVTPSTLYQIRKHAASRRLEIADERIGFRLLEFGGSRLFTEVRYL